MMRISLFLCFSFHSPSFAEDSFLSRKRRAKSLAISSKVTNFVPAWLRIW